MERNLWCFMTQRSDITHEYSNISLQLKFYFQISFPKNSRPSTFCCWQFRYSECSIRSQQILEIKVLSRSCCELRSIKNLQNSYFLVRNYLRNYYGFISPFLSQKILCVCFVSVMKDRIGFPEQVIEMENSSFWNPLFTNVTAKWVLLSCLSCLSPNPHFMLLSSLEVSDTKSSTVKIQLFSSFEV